MAEVLATESRPFMPEDEGDLKSKTRIEVVRGEARLSNDTPYAGRHYAARGNALRHIFDGTRMPMRIRDIFPNLSYPEAWKLADFAGLLEPARFGPKRKGLAWFHRAIKQTHIKQAMRKAYIDKVAL